MLDSLVRTQSDIHVHKRYRTGPDIGTFDIELKMAESDLMSESRSVPRVYAMSISMSIFMSISMSIFMSIFMFLQHEKEHKHEPRTRT